MLSESAEGFRSNAGRAPELKQVDCMQPAMMTSFPQLSCQLVHVPPALVHCLLTPHTGLALLICSDRHHRRQNTDHVADTHLRNVYHMSRRIENMYSVTERKKNIFDTSIYPVCIRRPQQNDVCRSVSQWKPQQRNGQRGPSRCFCIPWQTWSIRHNVYVLPNMPHAVL